MKPFRLCPFAVGLVIAITSWIGCSLSFPHTAVSGNFEQVDTTTLPFTDIDGSYAKSEILDLYNRKIITGYGDQRFGPQNPVLRSEFLTMLDQLLQMKPIHGGVQFFKDVPPSQWSYPWIQTGVNLGLAAGTSPDMFEPNRPLKREEAAVLLVRVLQTLGIQPSAKVSPFPDMDQADSWAVSYVDEIHAYQVMNGDAAGFRPQDPMHREEMAVVLEKLLQRIPQQSTATIGVAPSRTLQSNSQSIQLGWQYPNAQPLSDFEAQVEASDTINTLSPRWLFLDSTRPVFDLDDVTTNEGKLGLIQWAHTHGKQVWPLVGNRFMKDTTYKVLSDPTARAALIQQLVQFATQYGVDGFNIDFENLQVPPRPDMDPFLAFIQELKAALHTYAPAVKLSVDVPPDLGTDWSEPYQYAALANAADYIVVMAYDEHWNGEQTMGSVASLPWVTEKLQDLLTKVPANKLILGLPLYSRDWYVQNGRVQNNPDDLTISDEERILQQQHASVYWDAQVGQYVMQYRATAPHTIWMEESRSITLKYRLFLESHLAGAAFWYVGAGTPEIWDGIQNLVHLYNLRSQP
jgi:spore germination protein